MPNLVGIGNSQVPTNAMLGGMAYQDTDNVLIRGAEIENIAAIKARIGGTARYVYVYNTSNDTDGGAWRYRCQDKSWYNEPLGTRIRGHRREFPSIAVIYCDGDYTYIHDGDDPNCPLWMWIEFTLGGGTNTCVHMLNGHLVVGASNNGIMEMNFVADRIQIRNHAHLHTFNQGIYPARQSRTVYNSITQDSGANMGDPSLDNEIVNDIDMVIEPIAAIDPVTDLPKPTIGVACGNNDNGGLYIIRGTKITDHYVIRRDAGGDYDIKTIKFTTDGLAYYFNSDYSPSDGHGNMVKYGHMEDTYQLPDFYSVTDGVLANWWWYIHRTDTAHDSIGAYWGVYRGGGNTVIQNLCTWENRQGALSTNGGGITQWKLFSDVTHNDGNKILYNWIACGLNSGWMPNGTQFNMINADITLGSLSSGSTVSGNTSPRDASMTTAGGSALTVQTVNTGTELKCMSGFASSRYVQNTTSAVNYGSGASFELTLMGWVKLTDISAYSYIASVYNTTHTNWAGIAVHISGSRGGQVYMYDNTNSAMYSDSDGATNMTINNGEWHHICGVWNGTTDRSLYINGRLVGYSTSAASVNFDGTQEHNLGHYRSSNTVRAYHCLGHISLVKYVNGAPTPDQVWQIYDDERKMFDAGAQVSLLGSSNNMLGLDYDNSTGILHTGNSSGRSDFRKLVRINNTTTPLVHTDHQHGGDYNQISAAGGLVATTCTS